uniref:Bcp-type thiol peroxidase n=1 Tax=hospital metagenome TaxID=1755691 RepID=A0A4P9D4L5_9ZZZZ
MKMKTVSAFDAIKMKNMANRCGDRRSTSDRPEGILRHEWRKVKVDGHAEAVLFEVKQLNK